MMLDDRPIQRSSDDLLDRGQFAIDVASHLCSGSGEEGWVAGLYAQWGEGKSSVLNMVAERLASKHDVLVLRFEPWQFRTSEDLLPSFLSDLADLIRGPHNSRMRRLAEEIDQYAQHLTGHISSIPAPFDTLAGLLVGLTRRWLYPRLDTQKKNIAGLLRHHKRRIVVIVDDLDRLGPAEGCEMLRLVRLVPE